MPIQFKYVAEQNCLCVVGKGRTSLREFLEYHAAVRIPDPRPSLLILADYRELDPSGLSISDIEEIRASALRRTENRFEAIKEAIVVSDGLTYGLSRMFDGVLHSERYEVNVFTDLNDARDWLGLTPQAFANMQEIVMAGA